MVSAYLDQQQILAVASDRIARSFSMSEATQAAALDKSKTFRRVWHAGHLHKLKSDRILGYVFGLILSSLSHRRLKMLLDRKSSK